MTKPWRDKWFRNPHNRKHKAKSPRYAASRFVVLHTNLSQTFIGRRSATLIRLQTRAHAHARHDRNARELFARGRSVQIGFLMTFCVVSDKALVKRTVYGQYKFHCLRVCLRTGARAITRTCTLSSAHACYVRARVRACMRAHAPVCTCAR